jgi:hypothetical protein
MNAISAEVLAQLDAAQAAIEPMLELAGPPLPAEMAVPELTEPVSAGAGCATAQHVLLGHYFTSSARRLYAYAGGAWRSRNVTSTEEAGLVQVAFAADTVVVCWNASNQLTLMRCFKTF